MRTLRLLPRLAALLAFSACGPAPVPEVPPPPAPPPAPPPGPTVISPARWLERHPEALTPTASHKLPTGGTLHAAEHGERWIEPDGHALPTAADADAGAPRMETATFMLPEQIIAIAPSGGKWAFFGISGRAFLAATPLGAIEEVRPAPGPIRTIAVGSAAVVAVTRGGELLRSTDGGAHWSPVSAPALAPAVPDAVVLRGDGVGVLQALPQRVLVTADDGATWAPLAMPAGSHRVELSEEGDIWLAEPGYYGKRTHHLDGKPPAFVARAGKGRADRPDRSRKDRDNNRYESDSDTQRAAGKKYIVAVGRPYKNDPWKVQVSEWDHEGEWKAVPELESCQGNQVSAAAWEEEILLGCAREEKGGAGEAKFRLALFRSKDGGASWVEEGGVPLWQPGPWLFPGPDGWLMVHRACPKDAKDCDPYLIRPAAGQPFATLPVKLDTEYASWEIDPPRHRIVALSRGGQPKAARVHTWDLSGKEGKTTELFATDNSFGNDVTVDEQGAIVVAAMMPDKDAKLKPGQRPPDVWRSFRSTDDGATFTATPIVPAELKMRAVHLKRDRGLAADTAGHLWETADSARTWVPVTGPQWRNGRLKCTREGCAIGAEIRQGWDLASPTSPPPAAAARVEPPPPVPGAAPLRCSAGEGKEIAAALLDVLADIAVPARAGGSLVIPAAGKGNGLDLVLASAADGKVTTKATSVFPAAPNRASVGSHTEVLLTSAGVVATRATYPVDSAGADVWISPVSAELAWWRPRDSKVVHGRVPPLGKGHMRGTFIMGERTADRDEVLSLLPDTVVYRPDVGRGHELFTFTDKGGAPAKVTTGAVQGAQAAIHTPGGLALLAVGSEYESSSNVRFAVAAAKSEDPGTPWAVAPRSSSVVVLPMQRGADGAVVVAWSEADGPAHGFIVPLKPGDAPSEVTDLGLASLLVEHPRACGEGLDPASVRFRLPLPRAARHAVLLEGGPQPILVRVEEAVIVVSPQGQACVSEWIGERPGDETEMALIPVADPKRAWSLTASETQWEGGLHSRKVTVRALRCEESPGLAIPASFEFKGF